MTPTLSVHIVDDDDAIREGLSLLLETAGFSAHAYPDAESFLNRGGADLPGCVLLDVRMPGMSGLDLLGVLKRKQPELPVVIITGHADVPMAVQALKAGADDFIEKPFDEDVLLAAVRKALDRGRRALRERDQVADIRRRTDELTPREREVMELVVRGLSNKAAAAELDISVRTVEIHRARVMEKMAADSLSALVRMALRLEEDSGRAGALASAAAP
ncbi:MAG: response regulator FixJ [Actinomycetota bacterium]